MNTHLTERIVKAAVPAAGRNVILRDDEVIGFGVRLTEAGAKSFVLSYRIRGRERRITIGAWPTWSVAAAREEAERLKREIDGGHDPLESRQEALAAATVRELINRYIEEHTAKLASRNAADQTSMLRKLVEPEWGARKVAEITSSDVDRLLAKIAAGRARPRKEKPKTKRKRPLAKPRPTPIRANRVGEVLRKMFNLAIKPWGMRGDSPASGFTRNTENEREVFLTPDQIGKLAEVINSHENQRAADVVRLILLTGARKGEARTARLDQFNLDLAIWTKPAATTKQKKVHRAPLSRAAVAFLRGRIAALPEGCEWLFPGDIEGQPVEDIRRFWADVQKKAGLQGVRVHDLRHTFASLLISGGASLPIVGKLLGLTQAKTTQRYAHLFDDPVRQGVDAVGDMLRPKLKLISGDALHSQAA